MRRLSNHRLLYALSLPERSARAGVALAAGAVKSLADHVLPRALRSTHSYAAIVGRFERFLVETVGDVRGVYDDGSSDARRVLARKTVGNAIELATFAALRVSPVWFLAMAADASRGTRTFLEALTAELRREGFPVEERSVRTLDGLLDALERALGTGAGAADLPPLDPAGLRATWEAFKGSREPLPESGELAALFRDLQATAAATGRSLLSVSSVSGLGALAQRTAGGATRAGRSAGRAAVRLFDQAVIEDYRRSLAEMRARGFDRYAARVVRPYLAAARRHFDPRRETFTERRLGRGSSSSTTELPPPFEA
jgi:hypothetical protein